LKSQNHKRMLNCTHPELRPHLLFHSFPNDILDKICFYYPAERTD